MVSAYRKLISGLGILVAAGFASVPANAATIVNFSWAGNGGYTAGGFFTYNPVTTPVSFSEAPGVGPTQFVQSFTISFFSPQNVLLETGSSVINGVSSDRFFRVDFNTQTDVISALDADVGGSDYQYFLTNLRTPGGQVVGPGVSTFNLFVRTSGTPNLDAASSVQVSVAQTPEPSTFGLLASTGGVGLCGFLLCRRVAKLS